MPESRMSEAPRKPRITPSFPHLVIALIAIGVILTASVVPGIFTVDENNYLITVLGLRHGHVTVANTAGLSPSRELLFFDPGPWGRSVNVTPVASTAPPLYSLIALPFSFMGWRGLVALNTLAYLATIAMVFSYARRYSSNTTTPWLAASTFAFGGFSIEYAVGLWPHSLSVALSTAGIFAAGLLIETGGQGLAPLSGFVLGLATGVRYQNALVLAVVGAGIVAFEGRHRWRSTLEFGISALVPLSVSAAINHARLGTWNPVSKGPDYLYVPLVQQSGSSWFDPFVMFWARVVDYSIRPVPPNEGFEGWFVHDPTTGANLMLGIIQKKALLQSAPWAFLGLLVFVLTWLPHQRKNAEQYRQLRLLSILTLTILGAFAVAGVTRDDGLSFNQRYLLELVPLLAVAFGFALDGIALGRRPLLMGATISSVLLMLVLAGTPITQGVDSGAWIVRQVFLLKAPLLLALALGITWMAQRYSTPSRSALAFAVGLCLGWAATLHLADDVLISRLLRTQHRARTSVLAAVVPDGSAVIAFWGNKDTIGPLLFDRDLIILDPRADQGADASVLIHELLRSRRRVFVLDEGFPPEVRRRVIGDFEMSRTSNADITIGELHER
jgi:hypothetical protein